MTRKKYINLGTKLVVAMYKSPDSIVKGVSVGSMIRHFRDNAKHVPEVFGSYEAAWNCEAMKWARENYGDKEEA